MSSLFRPQSPLVCLLLVGLVGLVVVAHPLGGDIEETTERYEFTGPTPRVADRSSECIICIQDFVANNRTLTLDCGHKYHKQCVIDWFRHQPSLGKFCPLCRREITVNNGTSLDNYLDQELVRSAAVKERIKLSFGLIASLDHSIWLGKDT